MCGLLLNFVITITENCFFLCVDHVAAVTIRSHYKNIPNNNTKKTIANGKKIQIAIATWDKFGGRVLGDVLIDGKSLRVALIKNGYAREYYGLAKESWCN